MSVRNNTCGALRAGVTIRGEGRQSRQRIDSASGSDPPRLVTPAHLIILSLHLGGEKTQIVYIRFLLGTGRMPHPVGGAMGVTMS